MNNLEKTTLKFRCFANIILNDFLMQIIDNKISMSIAFRPKSQNFNYYNDRLKLDLNQRKSNPEMIQPASHQSDRFKSSNQKYIQELMSY